jgi:transposase
MTYSLDFRNAAIHAKLHTGYSLRRVVALLGKVTKSTLQRWLNQHPATRDRLPAASVVTNAIHQVVADCLGEDPFMTLSSLQHQIAVRLRRTLSCSTVSRVVRRAGYTRKRTYARAPDTAALLEKRSQCRQTLAGLDQADVISIDETCIYLAMNPKQGYAPKGTRLHVPLNQRRHRKYTLIMAVSTQAGVLHWQLIPGSGNKDNFARFIADMPETSCTHVLMDNVAFHKSAVVRSALSDRDLTAVFTAPYSPEFNPIEMAFSCMKAHYRRFQEPRAHVTVAASDADVHERMAKSIEQVTAAKIQAMFGHVWRMCTVQSNTAVQD